MHIPTSMGTQHPDSAGRYVPIQEEAAEAVAALTPAPAGLGLEEFMIDFEGKMTPYHQTADIVHRLIERGLIPGRDVWLTPRVSSASEETVFRQLMALMSVIEADYDLMRNTERLGGIKEVILPMVRGADDLVVFRRRIADIVYLAHKEFGMEYDPDSLQIIPLVEDIPTMLAFASLYREYHAKCGESGFTNRRLRFMIGRSDSAMIYGMPASSLACKLMISDAAVLGQDLGLESAPIFGGGALPFRGHVTVDNLRSLLKDFSGVKTITIQAGIRYDHPVGAASEVAKMLKRRLPRSRPILLSVEDAAFTKDVLVRLSAGYMEALVSVVGVVAGLADIMPRQRDRLTRRGPGGYARRGPDPAELEALTESAELRAELSAVNMPEQTKLPRAIGFTAAMYSAGLPPEFLGLGPGLRSIAKAQGQEGIERLKRINSGLLGDVGFARQFISLKIVERFFGREFSRRFAGDLEDAEKYLGVKILGDQDTKYETLLEIIEPLARQAAKGELLGDEDGALFRTCTVRLGKMRGSLG